MPIKNCKVLYATRKETLIDKTLLTFGKPEALFESTVPAFKGHVVREEYAHTHPRDSDGSGKVEGDLG